jgi:hypothetical protein
LQLVESLALGVTQLRQLLFPKRFPYLLKLAKVLGQVCSDVAGMGGVVLPNDLLGYCMPKFAEKFAD